MDVINKFVPAYAPSFENDVPAYIRDVLSVATDIAESSGGAIDLGRLGPASGGGNTSGCGDSQSFQGGDLSETTLAYAWPEDDHSPATQKKPEYADAIDKASQAGQYIGNDGVDCGAFVTRLMIDSGFEPNYNYSGKISDGASSVAGGQLPWLKANWEPVTISSTTDLKPGDVGVNDDASHTYVYVGNIPGFPRPIASASDGERAPMASKANPMDSSYNWYRRK